VKQRGGEGQPVAEAIPECGAAGACDGHHDDFRRSRIAVYRRLVGQRRESRDPQVAFGAIRTESFAGNEQRAGRYERAEHAGIAAQRPGGQGVG
jgi:hypothetical protein